MPHIPYDNLCELLIRDGYLKGREPLPTRRPTHGNCCTCQGCGQDHDDCVCEHNRLLAELEKLKANNP